MDVSSAIVGGGTLTLALVTAWMAFETRKSARHAAQEVDLSRVALERAHRPVIVPASSVERTAFRGGIIHEAGAGPAVHEGQLVVSIENIGMGPALNVRGEVLVMLGNGTIPWGVGIVRYPIEGIAAGGTNAAVFVVADGQLSPTPRASFRLAYEDVAGRSYWTSLEFESDPRSYRCQVGDGELPADLVIAQARPAVTPDA